MNETNQQELKPVIGSLLTFKDIEHNTLSSSFVNPLPLLDTFFSFASFLQIGIGIFSTYGWEAAFFTPLAPLNWECKAKLF
jgi:hypothetical protein